ncbi:hypothetical protein M9H77_16375 [Catharanthus roseus]|uniref:Uncharacterized protein n=1 Tax=Catharanthus roseus TaxID=4058 RepID=A0ACC0B1K5_CATRO|nr:hypothetical protein M9H77_16375 [Catharanthus roseus]
MLRRTKCSTDREGRPILVLPPADIQVIYCERTEAERDFYDALFKRSKGFFSMSSRGDTQEFSDLDKLARRFLKGGQEIVEGKLRDTPSPAYVQEVVEELRKGEIGECPICLEAFEDAVLTPCAHRLCRECLLASWRNASSGLCPVCRLTINRQELITAPTQSRFQVDIEKNWVESSKVSALLHELQNLQLEGSKSIVFSQWTAFLDLLQVPLLRDSISFVRLDGTLNQQQREKVIKQFSEDDNVMVLLMSLKAGGVGINLTAASNAFLLDPWWNPAVEEQAVMRIHRIGQTKSVKIKKFIVKDTVEERMLAVQARKQRIISGALTDQEVVDLQATSYHQLGRTLLGIHLQSSFLHSFLESVMFSHELEFRMVLVFILEYELISFLQLVKMQQYYRLGSLDNCSAKFSALFDCLNLKTKRSSEVEEILERREKEKPHIWSFRTPEEAASKWEELYGHLDEVE